MCAGGSYWPSAPDWLQPTHQLLENMYNTSFRARGLELWFDTSGNVNMDYDLKLWVWQDPTPKLHTVGAFDGRWSSGSPSCPGTRLGTR